MRRVQATGDTLFPFCELEVINKSFDAPIPSVPGRVEVSERVTLKSDDMGTGVGIYMDVSINGETGGTPHQGEITLKNLSPATKQFIRYYSQCNVTLGYRDGIADGVFSGRVTRRENYRRGTDDVLILSIIEDLGVRWNTKVAFTKQNVDVAHIVEELARLLDTPIGRIELTGVAPAKVSVFGEPAVEVVRNLLRDYVVPETGEDWKFNFYQGHVDLYPVGGGVTTGIVLSPENGLKFAEFTGTEYDDDAWSNLNRVGALTHDTDGNVVDGAADVARVSMEKALLLRDVQFESLMRPDLTTDAIIRLESRNIQGFYVVKNYTHDFPRDGEKTTSGVLSPIGVSGVTE